MKMTYKQVLEAAFSLGKRDRLKLREQLNINLDPKPANGEIADGPALSMDGMTDEEFEAELNRRHEEAVRDPSVMIPWKRVYQESLEEAARGSGTSSARSR